MNLNAHLAWALAVLMSGCANNAVPPAPTWAMPVAYVEAVDINASVLVSDWWLTFNSAELAPLIAAALSANPDLAIATEHIIQAQAQVQLAGASIFPALGLAVATTRRESRVDGGDWQVVDGSSAGLVASYEVDLWGKNAAGRRAADARLEASRYDRENVRLTLAAGVAEAYFQLLTLRTRLTITRANLAVAERVLAVVDSRQRNGAVSMLDLARQQATVLAQRAAVPPLELQERQTLFALAILLGRVPEGFDPVAVSIADLNVPVVAPGLPSQLLRRRPDIASAEARLIAADADLAAARAALLPTLALTGSAGLASEVLLNFMHNPTVTLGLGAGLIQSIFDGGLRRTQVDLSASQQHELLESYRKAVLAALADVESALAAAARGATQESLQQQVTAQAHLALKLAEIRYREGADDLLVVLDAQRSLFQAEEQLAQIRLSRLQASVSLFRALGGGWTMPTE